MKLDVPFFKQTSETNCGPYALKMVLAYFGEDIGIKTLEMITEIKEGKIIYTIQIATAAALLWHKTDFYSKQVLFNKEHLKTTFYQKFNNMDPEQSKEWVRRAKEAGVNIQERTVSLEEILAFVKEDSVPIVLIDWNVVNGKEGYHGEFAPVVGYDEQNVYIHQHGRKDTQAFMPIERDIFDEARRAQGTDEDIVVVHRK